MENDNEQIQNSRKRLADFVEAKEGSLVLARSVIPIPANGSGPGHAYLCSETDSGWSVGSDKIEVWNIADYEIPAHADIHLIQIDSRWVAMRRPDKGGAA